MLISVLFFSIICAIADQNANLNLNLNLVDLNSEVEALEFLKIANVTGKVLSDNVSGAIKKGWCRLGQAIVLKAHELDVIDEVSPQVRSAVQYMKGQNDELIRLLNAKHSETVTISPAFQWAQSPSQVFLNIRFTARWNSPGALSVSNETVTITEDSFSFSGSNQRKIYVLEFVFFGKVEPKECAWSVGSVDHIKTWRQLTKTVRISNMSIWWEMNEKHSAAMEELQRKEYEEIKEKNEKYENRKRLSETPPQKNKAFHLKLKCVLIG
eukprot:Platyproteum_vivax@DN3140_c0_g1_i1.p1